MIPVIPILKGVVSFLPGFYGLLYRGTDSTLSARYCYAVWLRHLVLALEHGLAGHPRTIAELGPGASIGAGLAGLITGASAYVALDVERYAKPRDSLRVLDELVCLVSERSRIPDSDEFPDLKPRLESYDFPHAQLTPDLLKAALAPARIGRIRDAVEGKGGAVDGTGPVEYIAPWDDPAVIRPASVEFLFSQAVLEHIDDLEGAYRAFTRWLKPGAFMSHQIDFKSHRNASGWDGHWTCSDSLWKLIRGRRKWLINREPYSIHRRLHERSGFEVAFEQKAPLPSGIRRQQLAPRFSTLSEEDLTTSGAFVLARFRGTGP